MRKISERTRSGYVAAKNSQGHASEAHDSLPAHTRGLQHRQSSSRQSTPQHSQDRKAGSGSDAPEPARSTRSPDPSRRADPRTPRVGAAPTSDRSGTCSITSTRSMGPLPNTSYAMLAPIALNRELNLDVSHANQSSAIQHAAHGLNPTGTDCPIWSTCGGWSRFRYVNTPERPRRSCIHEIACRRSRVHGHRSSSPRC